MLSLFEPTTLRTLDGDTASIVAHGAHVTSWRTANGVEQLYLSPRSAYHSGAAIRGGVPIIFPQFNMVGPLPRHGFARTAPWQLVPQTQPSTAVFAWRDDEYIQAIGTSPVVIPDKNRAFITTAYPKGRPLGGVMVEYDADFQPKEVWQSKKLGVHWMNPVYHEGHLYAIDGETEPKSRLVCVNADTGAEVWEQKIEWEDAEFSKQTGRANPVRLSILRASLLKVDGAFLCLGEIGSLHWLDLSPSGAKVLAQAQLFYALNTWSLPALSHGLLYVRQQSRDLMQKTGERTICLDLRAE